MRTHYLPKYYLKGFSTQENEEMIFVYSKNIEKVYKTNIINKGVINDLYPLKIENYLANEIEWPTNRIIEKIKKREALSKDEKDIFSDYIIVLLKRNPSFRELIFSFYPQTIENVIEKVMKDIEELRNKNLIDEIKYFALKSKIEEQGISFITDDKKVDEIWLEFIEPASTPLIRQEILNMTWIFYYIEKSDFFISCDNPFFYFKGLGFRKEGFSLPLTKNVALLGKYLDKDSVTYINPRPFIIHEINRRSIFNAKTDIFSPIKATWIKKNFKNQEKIKLHRIKM